MGYYGSCRLAGHRFCHSQKATSEVLVVPSRNIWNLFTYCTGIQTSVEWVNIPLALG